MEGNPPIQPAQAAKMSTLMPNAAAAAPTSTQKSRASSWMTRSASATPGGVACERSPAAAAASAAAFALAAAFAAAASTLAAAASPQAVSST